MRSTDDANAEFWNELCGSWMARQLGITGRGPDEVARFDRAYFEFYPYLERYLAPHRLTDRAVLEIGLGFGSVGQRIAEAGARYCAVDIAEGPLTMMAQRLLHIGAAPRVIRASAARLPFGEATFDDVISIGCLHHTGDVAGAVGEVHRVLKPGGRAVVMLYNQFSYRQWLRFPIRTAAALFADATPTPVDHDANERQRCAYDANSRGVAAPHTVFVSRRRIDDLFRDYHDVHVRTENCDDIIPGGGHLGLRRRLLGRAGSFGGLDLYVVARK